MRRRLSLLATLAFACCLRRSWAAAPAREQIDIIRPPHAVSALAQAPNGVLLVGSLQGLARYDGAQFAPLLPPEALAAPWISHLVATRAGSVLAVVAHLNSSFTRDDGEIPARWVGVGALWWSGSESRFLPSPLPPQTQILDATADSTDGVWAGTAHGLLHWRQGQWSRPVRPVVPDTISVRALAPHGRGLWISTGQAVAIATDDGLRTLARIPGVVLLAAAPRGVWAASDRAIWWIAESGQSTPLDLRLVANSRGEVIEINALLVASDNTLWVGSSVGLSHYDAQGLPRAHIGQQRGLADPRVTALLEDTAGALWAGTRAGGLVRVREPTAETFGTPEGLTDQPTAVVEDREGTIWVAGAEGVFRMAKNAPPQRLAAGTDLPGGRVLALAESPDDGHVGVLVALAGQGLLHVGSTMNAQPVVWTEGSRDHESVDFETLSITALKWRTTDKLWLSDARGHIAQARADCSGGCSLVVERTWGPAQGLCEGSTSDIALDEFGQAWIAQDHGVGHIPASGRAYCLGSELGLPRQGITAVVAGENRLWVGASQDAGIFLQQGAGNRFVRTTADNGLSCDSIRSLTDDSEGGLWSTCAHGLQWVRKSALQERASGGFPLVPAIGFAEGDGFRSVSAAFGAWPGAVISRRAHGLWFATTNGLSYARRPRPVKDPGAIGPWIESVLIDGTPQPRTNRLSVSARRVRLDIVPTTTSLASPSRSTIAYRLLGRDPEWQTADATVRTLSWDDLGEGHYVFEARAGDGFGTWSRAMATVAIDVERPVHQRVWFLTLCVALVAVSLLVAYRLRLRAARRRFAALTEDRARVARDLHDLLGQSFTAVGLQIDAARRAVDTQSPGAVAFLEQARAMVNHSKDDLRHAVWNLRSGQIDAQPLASSLEALIVELRRLPGGIPIELSVSGPVPPRSALHEHEILQIAREAIGNALKHSQATRINIQLSTTSHEVELVVRDDGCGIGVDLAAMPDKGHFGILGMIERSRRIGAEVVLAPVIPNGTEVRCTVPLERWRKGPSHE